MPCWWPLKCSVNEELQSFEIKWHVCGDDGNSSNQHSEILLNCYSKLLLRWRLVIHFWYWVRYYFQSRGGNYIFCDVFGHNHTLAFRVHIENLLNITFDLLWKATSAKELWKKKMQIYCSVIIRINLITMVCNTVLAYPNHHQCFVNVWIQ